jgi:hypothetical protein
MIKVNGRTISDDYIIRVETLSAAKKVVVKLKELGYRFSANVEKYNCYYIASKVVFDDVSEPIRKFVQWGRDEVKRSEEFDIMQTYEEFMGEPEPEYFVDVKLTQPEPENLSFMTRKELEDIGFYGLPHFTVANNLLFDLGRNRHLSIGDVGTPNEMMYLQEISSENPKEITDLVCVHNYDYDGYLTKKKLESLCYGITGKSIL